MAARRVRQQLEDLCEAIVLARDIVDRGRAEYDKDWALRAALVREFMIIGDTIVALPQGLMERYPETPWADARAMRNKLVHRYFEDDPDTVWQTAVEDLPPLLDQMKRILAELEDSE